jgi:hypothetical protein
VPRGLLCQAKNFEIRLLANRWVNCDVAGLFPDIQGEGRMSVLGPDHTSGRGAKRQRHVRWVLLGRSFHLLLVLNLHGHRFLISRRVTSALADNPAESLAAESEGHPLCEGYQQPRLDLLSSSVPLRAFLATSQTRKARQNPRRVPRTQVTGFDSTHAVA